MPEINLPQREKSNVYDFGFNQYLNREFEIIENPLVYNQIEDRLSKLLESSGDITKIIPGLPISDLQL